MESLIPQEEVLQEVANNFASWFAPSIVALGPHPHTEEKGKSYTA